MAKRNDNKPPDDGIDSGEIDLLTDKSLDNFEELVQDFTSSKASKGGASKRAVGDERGFSFDDFERIGYGELLDVTVRLKQTTPVGGVAMLRFNQDMRCRRSDHARGDDLNFRMQCWDASDFLIGTIHFGGWDRRCRRHAAQLSVPLYWGDGINLVTETFRTVLWVRHLRRVHNCKE